MNEKFESMTSVYRKDLCLDVVKCPTRKCEIFTIIMVSLYFSLLKTYLLHGCKAWATSVRKQKLIVGLLINSLAKRVEIKFIFYTIQFTNPFF